MNIIIKPIITEKRTTASEKHNVYGFVVHRKANKYQIVQAIKELYDIDVESVNTLIQRGKKSVRNTKTGFIQGSKSSVKKAFVKLKDGQVIDFYSNI
ncbi:MAG: 50S ribosomal protein L23 [Bacteroidales bacterium]|nr:50S ribosomal protein L23 [Bacteroidales bacterium]MDD4575920.1 50S ribosomal protein L23 [Bacteroidales bacterium]MDY0216645.1 50S ribosomal protein L23 [Bacteroidales bacterium]